MVAALVRGLDDEENWILAEVVSFLPSQNKYEVDDIDEEQKDRHILSKCRVVPLPLMRANPETDGAALFPKGTMGKRKPIIISYIGLTGLISLQTFYVVSKNFSERTVSADDLLLQGNYQSIAANGYRRVRASVRGRFVCGRIFATALCASAVCYNIQAHEKGEQYV